MTEEPRKLRELIAEGHEQFWVKMWASENWGIAFLEKGSDSIRFGKWWSIIKISDYADADALPIPKPTVTL